MTSRELYKNWWVVNGTGSTNSTDIDSDDFTSNLMPAADVSIDAVVTSIYLNAIAFVVLMATYELLRRLLPAVYSSEMKRQYKKGVPMEDTSDHYFHDEPKSPTSNEVSVRRFTTFFSHRRSSSMTSLPDVVSSFNWVNPVFEVSWSKVRRIAGLDGYFFLRFIRMNLRITAVTTFWACLVLVPIYATGEFQNGESGWYHLSIANVIRGSWRMWVPSCFAYFLTGFIFFVMKQEYRHFLELRMEFLARGTNNVNPQHHYSLKVENIPFELRSEKALFDYFDKLFPGKVHSTTIVLNLPDLETVKLRCERVCRRLEKSIAHFHATGKRATHNVGSPRIRIAGIDLAPFDWSCGTYPEVAYVDNRSDNVRPARGTHVDSISYYTHDLADMNRDMYSMQQRKTEIAVTGNSSFEADHWFSRVMMSAYDLADRIMVDSAEHNALRANYSSYDESADRVPQAEQMTSRYGSFGPLVDVSPRVAQCNDPFPIHRNEPRVGTVRTFPRQAGLDRLAETDLSGASVSSSEGPRVSLSSNRQM